MACNETVDWIIKQSKRFPLLTAEQEITYSRQVQTWQKLKDLDQPTPQQQALIRRGQRAYQHMFCANIRLAVAAARPFTGAGITLDTEDLIQEGLLGVERAILKFDPTRGYKFSTYAFPMIRGIISRAIDNRGRMIRVPAQGAERVRKVMRYCDQRLVETGQRPTLSEAAEALGLPLESLRQYVAQYIRPFSLDQPLPGASKSTGELTYLDTVANQLPECDWASEIIGDGKLLQQALDQLTPGQRAVIDLMYNSEVDRKPSLNAIGKQLGVVREAVRSKHLRALKKLRFYMNDYEAA